MKGARRYAKLFKRNQQFGKLYAQVGEHARGKEFHLWILSNEDRIDKSIHIVKDAIEVYGVVSGNPGWTESYGWLHRGPWEKDFEKWVYSLELAEAKIKQQNDTTTVEREEERKAAVKALLEKY